jgi:hypothetical protein
MGWHRVTDKATGEAQFVQAESRAELDRLYPTAIYARRTLDREPGEADAWENNALVEKPERRARIEREARWGRMSRAELADALVEPVAQRAAEIVLAKLLPTTDTEHG